MGMLMKFVFFAMMSAVFIAAAYSSCITDDNHKKREALENALWVVAFVLLVCCIAIDANGM